MVKRIHYVVAALLISAFAVTARDWVTLKDFEEPELDMSGLTGYVLNSYR